MDVVKLPAATTVTETVAAPPSWADRLVSGWELIAACSIFFNRAFDYLLYFFYVHWDPSSIFMRCVNLTDAEAAEETALWGGILCCAALQAAAAVLALLLPSRRRRLHRGIEFIALAAAFLDHYMYYAVVCLILTADPEFIFYRVSRTAFIGFLAGGDILGSIALILEECVGGEEQAAAAATA